MPIFCQECLNCLEMIDAITRCPFCFSQDYEPEGRVCRECRRHPPLLDRVGAVFDYTGPAAELVCQMKYGGQRHLAEGAGAWMAVQYLDLKWPKPDLIVPVPIEFSHWLERGYNQSQLLGSALENFIHVPQKALLGRRMGSFSQAGLTKQQRLKLDDKTIYLKHQGFVRDKNVLLVDDVMTTGSTLRRCAEALMTESPKSIYGLVFCRAIE